MSQETRTAENYPLTCVDLPDGSMLATGTIAAPGVMQYRWGAEAVTSDCLADPEWLRTACGPLTLEHPEPVNGLPLLLPENISVLQDPEYTGPGRIVGTTRVWWDGNQEACKVEVRTLIADIADGIRHGKYELSPGYLVTDVERVPGQLDGVAYQQLQRRRLGNHCALVLKKEFGGRGARDTDARFDSNDDGGLPPVEATMTPDEVKALIAAALEEYSKKDNVQDAAATQGGNDLSAKLASLEEKLARIDGAIAAMAQAEKAEETPKVPPTAQADAKEDGKPAMASDVKPEDEARADAADEVAVRKVAASRGYDLTLPLAELRTNVLKGSSYEAARRPLQRIYVSTLADSVRADANDSKFDGSFGAGAFGAASSRDTGNQPLTYSQRLALRRANNG